MKKNFSLFLALRYLRPKRTFISIITIISILGPVLGVGVLIITISIMTGFELELKKVILGFEPHVTVVNRDINSEYAEDDWWEIIENGVDKIPEVLASSVYVEGPVLLEATGDDGVSRRATPMMRGLPGTEEDYQFKQLSNYMQSEQNLRLLGDEIVVSQSLAQRLHLRQGQKVNVISGKNAEEIIDVITKKENEKGQVQTEEVKDIISEMVTPRELVITGFFDQPRYDQYVFVPLHIAQELYGLGGDVHGFSIYMRDPYRMFGIVEKLKKVFPEHLNTFIYTWMDKHSREFNAIRNERSMMYLVLFVILIVAAFCIMNTLITVTTLKKTEIGVCKALGANTKQIMGIFMYQGLIVGLVGTTLGFFAGVAFVSFRNQIRDFMANFGVNIFPSDIYGFNSIPAKIVWADVSIICLGSIILCTLAAAIPAYMVAKLDAAKALRNE